MLISKDGAKYQCLWLWACVPPGPARGARTRQLVDATLPMTAADPTSDRLGDTEGPAPRASGECVGPAGLSCAADELLSG